MNLHNLLVVVDPSSDEQPALTRAQWIAERSGASVELLLCDFNPALDGGLFFDSHSLQRARDLYLDERVTWLEQLSMPLQQAGIRTQVEAQWGKPLDRMVLQRVGETRPDLVLKSTRKHNLLRRLLLGNSDWQLIRHCPQPLWLVHHDAWRGQRLRGARPTACQRQAGRPRSPADRRRPPTRSQPGAARRLPAYPRGDAAQPAVRRGNARRLRAFRAAT